MRAELRAVPRLIARTLGQSRIVLPEQEEEGEDAAEEEAEQPRRRQARQQLNDALHGTRGRRAECACN